MGQPTSTGVRAAPVQRYGPLTVIGLVLAVLAASAAVVRPGYGAHPDRGAKHQAVTQMPMLYADAKAAGFDLSVYGDRCDHETGRIKMPSVYAPPCVPVFSGDNHGETSQGVSATSIKVVEYIPAPSADLAALLQGRLDTSDASEQTTRAFRKMFEDLFETYGRHIEFIRFESKAKATDELGAKSDAVEIATTIGAFAAIGGPQLAQSYARELAARGVLCILCGSAVPDSTYQDMAPYMWADQSTPEQFLENLADLVTNRLNNRPARFAGDPAMHDRQRRFGVVHFEQEVPVYTHVEEEVAREGKKRGYESVLTETYTLDLNNLGKLPERAQTIIAKLKDQDVTTVIFLGDPLMPIYLTKAATDQDYFPEWIVTGTYFTDTNVMARMYDQRQWSHAFGVSEQAAPVFLAESFCVHYWYYGQPPAAMLTNFMIYQRLFFLYLGIHMAGPVLTPETFRDGLFRYPPSGGGPTTPRMSYGRHGTFHDPQGDERTDYTGIDDVALIWWDAGAGGTDEQGRPGGGIYRYIDGAHRYLPGHMPTGDLPAFDPEGTVDVFLQAPPEDTPPQYPSPNAQLPT